MTGQRFGRLTVVKKLPDRVYLCRRDGGLRERYTSVWLCQCTCGEMLEVQERRLKFGCGCYGCARSGTKSSAFKHGAYDTPEYRSWQAMKTRCYNPKHRQYKDYGGRGITVCERWLASFENFAADMGRKPSPTHSLDRWPDRNGNYEPGNCRWATDNEQRRNRRTNVMFTYRGVTMCMTDWAKARGINPKKVWSRLKWNWTPSEALELDKP